MVQIHVCEPLGDILVFLTGEEEIEDACKRINKEVTQMGAQVRGALALVQTNPSIRSMGPSWQQHPYISLNFQLTNAPDLALCRMNWHTAGSWGCSGICM